MCPLFLCMGRFIRWQAILAVAGMLLLAAYLQSIVVKKVTVEVPAEGGIYREGNIGAVQYLNPLLAEYNPIDADIASLIFEGLTRVDARGELFPLLAENWTVSADGRTYVFVLRSDVFWADGAPLTADDVIFTLNLIRAGDFPGNPAWRDLWRSVKIEPVDDTTLRFVLDAPFPSFPYYTTIGILPKHLLNGISAGELLTSKFNLSPVGTGPFLVKKLTAQSVTLTRNPRFRGPKSRITDIKFQMYPSADALLGDWRAGLLDGIGSVPPQLLPELENQADVNLFSAPLPQYSVVYLNLQQPEQLPFFQMAEIRRALLMLIDRQQLIDDVLSGQAVVAQGPFLPWQWAFNPNQPFPDFNPSAAADLLAQAGWIDTDGDGIRDNGTQPLEFSLLVGDDPTHQAVADNLTRQWQQAGISVRVERAADGFSDRLHRHNFEAALVNIELFGDPDPYRFWHQSQIDGGQNFGGWDDTDASIALEHGRTTLTRNERIKDYYTFQQIFAQQTPALVLYYPVYTFAVRANVKNVQLPMIASSADRFATLNQWYLLTQQVIETHANTP